MNETELIINEIRGNGARRAILESRGSCRVSKEEPEFNGGSRQRQSATFLGGASMVRFRFDWSTDGGNSSLFRITLDDGREEKSVLEMHGDWEQDEFFDCLDQLRGLM